MHISKNLMIFHGKRSIWLMVKLYMMKSLITGQDYIMRKLFVMLQTEKPDETCY